MWQIVNNFDDKKKGPHFSSRAVTDGQYKLIWNLTPKNMYGIAAVSGIDFGKHNKGSDVPKIYGSWLDSMKEGGAHAAKMIKRYRLRPEYQLFDLNKDRWEMNNVASEHVDVAEHLELTLHRYLHWRLQGSVGDAPCLRDEVVQVLAQ